MVHTVTNSVRLFIIVINQLDAHIFLFLYMFRAPCAHHQEVKLYYTASGIITHIGGSPVHLCTGLPPIGMMIPEAV